MRSASGMLPRCSSIPRIRFQKYRLTADLIIFPISTAYSRRKRAVHQKNSGKIIPRGVAYLFSRQRLPGIDPVYNFKTGSSIVIGDISINQFCLRFASVFRLHQHPRTILHFWYQEYAFLQIPNWRPTGRAIRYYH